MSYRNTSTVRICLKGGILSPGDLNKITRLAAAAFVKSVNLGLRQEIFIEVHNRYLDELVQGLHKGGFYFDLRDSKHQNIVTSYCATDIFPTTNWITHEVYQSVLESFDFNPQFKINFIDPLQGLVPIFSGDLNFIASSFPDFWYLYISLPGYTNPYCWPVLLHTDHVALLSKEIEHIVLSIEEEKNGEEIYQEAVTLRQWDSRLIDKDLVIPRIRFPYYEGLNKANNSFWLGIYRRDYDFPVAFLDELAQLCAETKIGKVSLTCWKTLIIKDIKEDDRIRWEVLLGKYGINIRHSFSDLNWHVPDLDKKSLVLKRYLAREFDKKDIRTYGLIFSIGQKPFTRGASVYIEKKLLVNFFSLFKVYYRYTVYYREHFDVNASKLILYYTDVASYMLPTIIEELCDKYYSKLTRLNAGIKEPESISEPSREPLDIYQCTHCKTIYDKTFGEPTMNIPAGITFENLPENFTCTLCDAPKADFVRVDDFIIAHV